MTAVYSTGATQWFRLCSSLWPGADSNAGHLLFRDDDDRLAPVMGFSYPTYRVTQCLHGQSYGSHFRVVLWAPKGLMPLDRRIRCLDLVYDSENLPEHPNRLPFSDDALAFRLPISAVINAVRIAVVWEQKNTSAA